MFAALVAASVTSIFASYLTRHANDRRLIYAATILASELEIKPDVRAVLQEVVADEQRETQHTGIAFGVFDAQNGRLVAGDPRVPQLLSESCIHSKQLRACAVPAADNLWIVATSGRIDLSLLFAASSGLAALLAGLGAWLASRPIARWLMEPLSELRERVGSIDFSSAQATSLGPPTDIVEVDALRSALDELLVRIRRALQQAERFAADAAHELRTPLTTIRGELELLMEDATLPPTAQTNLSRAARRVVELQTLLERLLVLALPDESRWSGSEVVSLHELAEDLIAQSSEADRERITLSEPRGDVVVRGDTALLGLLFSNCLGNALKFGDRVAVSLFDDATHVVLRVDDNGPGIPEEQRLAVFEPFMRLAAMGQRPVAGHGLGLALIAHIARRHGGSARFIEAGAGAHLEIRLPHAPPGTLRVLPHRPEKVELSRSG
jgi:two-component system OmpR family sensor kinase